MRITIADPKAFKHKPNTITSTDTTISKLTKQHIQIAKKIKHKLRNTALTIVEVGQMLSQALRNTPKGYKQLFYNQIGISTRSAQRYQQIANHPKIQELKKRKQLDGKTMTDLLSIISKPNTNPKPPNPTKIANTMFSRYKDNPELIKQVIQQLQSLIEEL